MSWRLARSLEILRDEVDAEWPDRPTSSDGTIGDQAHRNRTSAHNPNSAGVVRAFDITAPQGHQVAERIRAARDRRIRLLISNRRICSSYDHADGPAWTWRPYSGSNPHTSHAHVEVHDTPALYDDRSRWFQEDDMAEHNHNLTDMPPWGQPLWDRFVADKVTSVPDSWKRVAHRLDLAWIYGEVIVPLKGDVSKLQAQVKALHTELDKHKAGHVTGSEPSEIPDHTHEAGGVNR